jgi:hypothetical protein
MLRSALMVVTMVVLAATAAASVPLERRPPDFQRLADEARWAWSDDAANLDDSVRRFRAEGCGVEVSASSAGSERSVRFEIGGREVLTLRLHPAGVFRARDSVLFVAEFHPSHTGCALAAYHLEEGRLLWRTPLRGLGPITHFDYRNRVNLEARREAVIVRGWETAGRYIELLDPHSGRSVGHRVFAGGE